MTDQTLKQVTFDGFDWYLRLPSNLDTELAAGRPWEPVVTQWILGRLKPGMTAVDVGANIGWHTLQMARAVGVQGQVYAFEPCLDFYRRLLAHVAGNGLHNVTAIPAALYHETCERAIHQNGPPYHSSATLGAPGAGGENMTRCLPLDSLDLPACDLMKIDVDGTEYEVLQGAAETIRRFRPALMVEIVGDCRPRETMTLLQGWGYALRPEDKSAPLSIEKILSLFAQGRGSINLLCQWKEQP